LWTADAFIMTVVPQWLVELGPLTNSTV